MLQIQQGALAMMAMMAMMALYMACNANQNEYEGTQHAYEEGDKHEIQPTKWLLI